MKGLADILHKIQIGEKNITDAHAEICSLFSVSGMLPTDEEIEEHWDGIEKMHLEAKRMDENQIKDMSFGAKRGAEWMRDLVKGNYR